jgi:hypothetical protein
VNEARQSSHLEESSTSLFRNRSGGQRRLGTNKDQDVGTHQPKGKAAAS